MHPSLTFSPELAQNSEFVQDWLALSQQQSAIYPLTIAQYINAKTLSCPMPLLKLKMALKTLPIQETVYLTATDPNSQQDIGAFCQHIGYPFISIITNSDSATIFHFLITKNS